MVEPKLLKRLEPKPLTQSGIGVVLQVPDQAAPQFPHVGFDLPDILPEAVQLGDHNLIPVGLTVAVATADYRPSHDDDQDSDGSDYLGQPRQVLHVRLPVRRR